MLSRTDCVGFAGNSSFPQHKSASEVSIVAAPAGRNQKLPENLHRFNVLLFENMHDGNILKQNTKTTGEADGIL